mmetsp:Transcript_33161/g.78543  ORF Transcript_33161/g.78543 Transcript_33161/m.78543 type:complete len:198 (-) Transcript_33161:304-897(-)
MLRNGIEVLDDGKSHPVIVIRNRLFDWDRSPHEMLQWQVYVHETMYSRQDWQGRGLVVIQDLSGFHLKDMWHMVRSGGMSLLHSFEQNISTCIMLGEPFYFASVWGVAKFLLPEKQRDRMHFLGSGGFGDPVVGKALRGLGGPIEVALRKLPTDQDIGGLRFGDLPLPKKQPWEDAFGDARAQRYREADAIMAKLDL